MVQVLKPTLNNQLIILLNKIYSEVYVTLNNNCTAFNGTTFADFAETQAVHTNGGMVSVQNSKLMVLGGGALDNPDTDIVEVYNEQYDNWQKVSSLPFPIRLFSTISMGQYVFTFGGYSGALQMELDYTCMYDTITDKECVFE